MLSFSQPPVHIIRPGHVEGQPIDEGAPYLQVSTTGFFSWIYNDRGTRARLDVTIYRPTPLDNVKAKASRSFTTESAATFVWRRSSFSPTTPNARDC